MEQRALIQCVTLMAIIIFGVIVFPAPTPAAPPNLINYQGSLTDTGGVPVGGSFPMTFRIYDVATGGTPLYEESQGVTVTQGIYNVLLGSVTPTIGTFSPALFATDPRWIEVVIGTEILTPRQRITSVAWSLRTQEAAHAATADDATLLAGQGASAYDQSAHVSDTGNPHGVTATQAGAAPLLHTHSGTDITTGTVAEAHIAATLARDSEIMPTVLANDGPGSGLDADMVDGKHAGDFSNTTSSSLQYGNLLAMITNLQQRVSQVEETASTEWQPPTLIETNNTASANNPQVAIDGAGNSLAVWQQSDGTRTNIWANRYTAGVGWGTALLIETDNAGNAQAPQIAMDGAGNGLALWYQSDGIRNNIYANRYTAGAGWGTALLIETNNAGSVYNPQVAMDGAGNGLALWDQSDGTRTNIWANRYTAGSGWGTALLIETDNAGNAEAPQVAMDGAGNGLALWYQWDGIRYNIYANRYTAGTGWGTAALIETDNTGSAYHPQVAMDGAGNGLALWDQSDGTRTNIWGNRYTAGVGWETATLIETDNTGYATTPQVAMDRAGNGLALWQQHDGTRMNIWANRYTAGVGWGTAVLIETDNAGYAQAPQVAMDGAGNGLALWQQYDGTRINIYTNRYTVGVGWGIAALIETDNTGNATTPQVAMNGAGNGLALWHQYDGTRYNIRSAYIEGGGWGTAALVETDNTGGAYHPQVAMDGAGNGLAVWQQSDGTRYNLYANRHTAGVGWGTALLIETDNTGDAANPQVAMDGAGNGLALWQQSDGTRNNIYANRYTAGVSWGTAALIETDNAGGAYNPQVAMDGAGNGLALWQQSDGTRYNIWANRYTAGTGWGTAALVETDNAGDASSPQVAMDGAGNGLALWQQSDGTRDNIWANRYTAGVGWSTAALIETDNAGNASSPQVAMDGTGNGLAIWFQFDGIRWNIWANRYTAGVGWGTAALIETGAGTALYPQVVMDGAGNGLALWRQSDGVRTNIYANRYTAGVGWGTAALVETDNAGDAAGPQVAMDGAGNGLALWYQYDGMRYNIYANRYTAGVGWGTAVLIETDNAGSAFSPQVVMDGAGNGLAVWYQSDGTRYNIQANRYRLH